ncbi:uncharacterized protein VTP21DRAFT_4639 [Calcarisporiella thermophila]|uniref:uncharacterized protein n=1 Tax=Calcarisporiella thermophila TaxID=911321 RepID=UPI003743E6F8
MAEDIPDDIPEFTTFEHQKENILPLRQGRSAKALASIFSLSPSGLDAHLAEGHARFQAELAALTPDDGDPLDVHHRYVRWVLEHYPQGHNHDSNLIPLLEKATRAFKDDERYRNDPRYLHLWLMYAKYVEVPRDIFVFLLRNEIGGELAAFYEDYGGFLESIEKYDQAKEIYELGIHRRAQPLEKLHRRFTQFQLRQMQRLIKAEEEAAQPQHADASAPARPVQPKVRKALGAKTTKPSSTSAAASSTPSALANPASAANGRALSGSRGLGGAATIGPAKKPVSKKTNQAKISIFVDPDGTASATAPAAPWPDVGTETSRRKENRVEATQWRGAKLRQAPTASTRPVCERIEVYRDEGEEEEAPNTSESGEEGGEESWKSITIAPKAGEEMSEAEMLIKNPFKNYSSREVDRI